MADDNRDIDLVLITGAGASREFGNSGLMPLMGDWSKFLLDKLRTGINYQEMVGLHAGLSGEEFESALGDFLRRVVAFEQIHHLIEVSMSSPVATEIPSYQLKNWYERLKADLDRVVQLVTESVFEQFHRDKVNSLRAAQAYGSLFEHLHISQESRLVYATTNYDAVGECALDELGWIIDSGEVTSASHPGASTTLRTEKLLEGLGRYTPVLHLHGKVGWYRRSDTGQVYSTPTTTHQPGFGVPILMLPDPQKSYTEDNVIMDMWSALEIALRRAQRILVLGHSLADSYLLRTLKANVDPRRLRITVFADSSGTPDRSSIPVVERVQKELPNLQPIPVRFGSSPDHLDRLDSWEPVK